jgi:hypothetical protein
MAADVMIDCNVFTPNHGGKKEGVVLLVERNE